MLTAEREAQAVAEENRRKLELQMLEEARQAAEIAAPSVESMLEALWNGGLIELNGHSIEWDQDFNCLAGTNAYGVDYFWGQLTIDSVTRWRSEMLSGRVIGSCPPGTDDGERRLVDVEPPSEAEYELLQERESLEHMADVVFTADLNGVVTATSVGS